MNNFRPNKKNLGGGGGAIHNLIFFSLTRASDVYNQQRNVCEFYHHISNIIDIPLHVIRPLIYTGRS